MALSNPFWSADRKLQDASENRGELRRWQRGDHIRKFQEALYRLGYPLPDSTRPDNSMDGLFGAECARLVRSFEFYNQLSRDEGIAGRQVLGLMDRSLATEPAALTTVRERMNRILRVRTIDINFTYGTRRVRSSAYGQVMDQIAGGRIGVAFHRLPECRFGHWAYERGTDIIFLRAGDELNEELEPLLVHEATHAASDIAAISTARVGEEAVAFVAQAVYQLQHGIEVHARPGCEQHAAATRVIHEARRVAAQEAIDSGGVGDGNRRALEDALLAHPVYRRIRGQVLNFDGV